MQPSQTIIKVSQQNIIIIIIIIIIINKVLIKVTLNKVITGALYIVCGWNAVKVQGWQLTVKWRLKQRWL